MDLGVIYYFVLVTYLRKGADEESEIRSQKLKKNHKVQAGALVIETNTPKNIVLVSE